jgi:hypothetical protein
MPRLAEPGHTKNRSAKPLNAEIHHFKQRKAKPINVKTLQTPRHLATQYLTTRPQEGMRRQATRRPSSRRPSCYAETNIASPNHQTPSDVTPIVWMSGVRTPTQHVSPRRFARHQETRRWPHWNRPPRSWQLRGSVATKRKATRHPKASHATASLMVSFVETRTVSTPLQG